MATKKPIIDPPNDENTVMYDENLEADIEYQHNNKDSDNPFIELRNLMDDKKIDLKTILSEKQITRIHKLGTLSDVLNNCSENIKGSDKKSLGREANLTNVLFLIDSFQKRFMKLAISKNGISRTQFIEALHKGGDKAEETRLRAKENKIIGL